MEIDDESDGMDGKKLENKVGLGEINQKLFGNANKFFETLESFETNMTEKNKNQYINDIYERLHFNSIDALLQYQIDRGVQPRIQ